MPELKYLADNKPLFDALKAFLLERFEISDLPEGSNADIGEFVRSRIEGRVLIEKAFAHIASLKTIARPSRGENPMR